MKKSILILVALLFGFTVYAQDIGYGLKAGLNLATITGDETDDLSSRFAFHAGGVVNFGISDKFSVQPEVLYSAQGFDFEGSDFGFDGMDGTFKMDYINIPVLAQYEVADGFSLEAGPQIGFMVSAKAEVESVEVDVDEFFKSTDFSGVVGANYALANGLNFDARYAFGLSDIWDIPEADDVSNKNGVFMFSIGYLFQGNSSGE
ncbi:MAG: PorT family protein [Bacteroidia bacterium]|nr:PorT family protein [Bacteroidia bacterium]MBT8267789.1 PorT family protein [Bacteroidia bacterium]NNF81749.1 PorT family protein [Flavobacteriaceae bacterium]NNK70908.1 PorT family protein [Flavobacteriaceae bacterium]NNL79325.1 PorT family protein [Flavobacteriaceae bacterium]